MNVPKIDVAQFAGPGCWGCPDGHAVAYVSPAARINVGAPTCDCGSAMEPRETPAGSERICSHCGSEVESRPGSGRQRDYCNAACRQAARRRRAGEAA